MGIVYAKESYETAVKKGSVYAIEQLADFAIYGKVLSSFANNCGELPVLEIRNTGFGNIVVVSFIFLCF